MDNPTQEQVKEFWEWCGWKEKPIARSFRTIDWPDYAWHDPNGEAYPDTGLPPIDLNNLFKYAVPTAITTLIVANGIDEYAALEIILTKWLEKFREGYSFPDALFWALGQVKED